MYWNRIPNQDRFGCPDTDGDGYSDADGGWTIANGADEWPNDATQWVDADGDGYGDNPLGNNGDDCPGVYGESTNDRQGCPDTDGDGYSDPDGSWTVSDGADAFPNDPTRSQDIDGDGVDDAVDDACPVKKDIRLRQVGCPDLDGYSDGDGSWTSNDGTSFQRPNSVARQ